MSEDWTQHGYLLTADYVPCAFQALLSYAFVTKHQRSFKRWCLRVFLAQKDASVLTLETLAVIGEKLTDEDRFVRVPTPIMPFVHLVEETVFLTTAEAYQLSTVVAFVRTNEKAMIVWQSLRSQTWHHVTLDDLATSLSQAGFTQA